MQRRGGDGGRRGAEAKGAIGAKRPAVGFVVLEQSAHRSAHHLAGRRRGLNVERPCFRICSSVKTRGSGRRAYRRGHGGCVLAVTVARGSS